MTKTATFIKDVSGGKGEQKLYQLEPSIETEPWDDDEEPTMYDYVVVSAVNAMFSGAETYIFGADADGKIIDWGELPGSYRGGYDHDTALEGAGYEVVE